jgi:hypothetical protein
MRTKRQNKPKRHAATKKGGKGKQYSKVKQVGKVKQVSKGKKFSKKAKSVNMRQRRRAVTRRKMRGGLEGDDDADEDSTYLGTESMSRNEKEANIRRREIIEKDIDELNRISDSGKNYTSDNFFATREKLKNVYPDALIKFKESDEGKKYEDEERRREEHENAGTFRKWRNNKNTKKEHRIYDRDEFNYLRKKFASLLRSGREDEESDLYKFVQGYGRTLLGYYVNEFPGTLKKYGFYYKGHFLNSLDDIAWLISRRNSIHNFLYDQRDIFIQTLKFFNEKHPLPATAATPSQTA